MNCDRALLAMLDADLSVLRGERSTPLGRHLGGCARCQRVASRLTADTMRLARAVSAPSVVRSRERAGRRASWAVAGTLLAAASIAWVVFVDHAEVVMPAKQAVDRPTAGRVVSAQPALPASSSATGNAPVASDPRAVPGGLHTRRASASRPVTVRQGSLAATPVNAVPLPMPEPIRTAPILPERAAVAQPYRAVAALTSDEQSTEGRATPPAPASIVRPSNHPNIIVVWQSTP